MGDVDCTVVAPRGRISGGDVRGEGQARDCELYGNRSGTGASDGADHVGPERGHADSDRFGIPGCTAPVGDLVEDPGAVVGGVRGRRELVEETPGDCPTRG